ncbi:MAG: YggT family protein [Anaerolineae bacterium]
MLIPLLIQILNVFVAVFGVMLILRVLLPWFGVSYTHPVLHFLVGVTEPLVQPFRDILGHGGWRWMGRRRVDLAPLVTLFVAWLAQTVITWLLSWVAAPPLWLLQPGQDLERWLVGVVGVLMQLYTFLLLGRVLLEWMRVSYARPLMRFLWDVTEPLLAPIRRRLPLFAGLDFSPLVALFLLSIAQMLLVILIRALF